MTLVIIAWRAWPGIECTWNKKIRYILANAAKIAHVLALFSRVYNV